MVTYPLDEFEKWFRITGNWWPDDTDPDNLIIHVHGDAKLKNWPMTTTGTLPYKFAEVSGNFDCHGSGLKELTGCPVKVGGKFDAGWNQLTNLKGGPRWVGDHYQVQQCGRLQDVSDVADHVGTQFTVGFRRDMAILKPFMNSQHVMLDRPPGYSNIQDKFDMEHIQAVLDNHAGEGRAGALKVAHQLIKLGFPLMAKM